jgi:hypothetical protein
MNAKVRNGLKAEIGHLSSRMLSALSEEDESKEESQEFHPMSNGGGTVIYTTGPCATISERKKCADYTVPTFAEDDADSPLFSPVSISYDHYSFRVPKFSLLDAFID